MTVDDLRAAFHAAPSDSAAGRELRRFQQKEAPTEGGQGEDSKGRRSLAPLSPQQYEENLLQHGIIRWE